MKFGIAIETDILQLIEMRFAYLSEVYHGLSEEHVDASKEWREH